VTIPPFVDAHHHLWDLDRHYHVWLHADPPVQTFIGPYESICVNYRVPEYLADADGLTVLKTVHVQAEFDPANPVGETEWLMEQYTEHGYPNGIVGAAHLDSPDLEQLLDGHMAHPNFRGIRHMLNWDPRPERSFTDRPDLMDDPAWRRGLSILVERDLSFDLQIWPSQMAQAAALLRSFPAARVVLNHTGFPIDRDEESMAQWRTGMRALAAEPGVMTKISGLGMLDHDWTTASIRPLVLETIEIFGVDRCMFATNFPVDRLFGSYRQILTAFSEITADFTPAERTALFSGTASTCYRI